MGFHFFMTQILKSAWTAARVGPKGQAGSLPKPPASIKGYTYKLTRYTPFASMPLLDVDLHEDHFLLAHLGMCHGVTEVL